MSEPTDSSAYAVPLSNRVSRVAKGAYPAFSPAPFDRLGSGRFDDLRGDDDSEAKRFRVAYCSEEGEAAMLEALQDQRVPLAALARLSNEVLAVVTERESLREQLVYTLDIQQGLVDAYWYGERHLVSADAKSSLPLFDLTNTGALQYIREELAFTFAAMGLTDLDLSTVTGADRNVSQAIALYLWLQKDADGQPLYAGIRYTSRFGALHPCLALFYGRVDFANIHTEPITPQTPALIAAAQALRLTIR